MAGGVEADIRTPWPKGEGSILLLNIPFYVPALVGGDDEHIVAMFTAPFSFKVKKAELSALDIIEAGTIQMSMVDDTGTPKEIFDNTDIAAITRGEATLQDLGADPTVVIFAGAIVKIIVDTTADTDTIINGMVNLWLEPVY